MRFDDPDAIDGGDESDGDAAPDLIDLVEVLHDLNKSKNGADDSDGRRETTSRLKDLRQFIFLLRLGCPNSSSMILRSSCGSVPSTASISERFKNGS